MIKSFFKIVILFTVIGFVVGCTKYERDNPNDLKNTTQGTAKIEFTRYEVKSDDNSDGLIQKNETVVLNLYFKNNGTNLTDVMGSVFQMPPNSQVVSNSFNYYNNIRCYVGKEALLATVTLKLSSSLTPGQILTMPYTITDINLGKHKGEIKVKIDGFLGSQLVIIDIVPINEESYFTSGVAPTFILKVKNNSASDYEGIIKTSLSSTDDNYKYSSDDLNGRYLIIRSGESVDLFCKYDCISKLYYVGQNLKFNVVLEDKLKKFSEREFSAQMNGSTQKLELLNPKLRDLFSPDEFFKITIDIKNISDFDSDLSNLKVSESDYVSITKAYFSDKVVGNNFTLVNGITIEGYLQSNCPIGQRIDFDLSFDYSDECYKDVFKYGFYGIAQ